jgi:autoinducer 2 (AI-2) kinase
LAGKYLAAIDAGTGAGRCLLVSLDGKEVYSAYREWSYYNPPDAPGGMEFAAGDFWRTICETVQAAMRQGSINGGDIVAVSTTSQREGVVLLDRDGKEIYAGPNLDSRAEAESAWLVERYGERLYQVSGHWPEAMFAPSRLLWLKEYRPAIYKAVARLLLINDWVIYRLSGEFSSEPSNACETLLYDIADQAWSGELAAELGIDPSILAPVVPAGTVVGRVTARAAAETGLAAGTPVVVGGADTQCGLLGMGVINPGEMAAVAGTTTPVQMVTGTPVLDPERRMWSGCHVVPGQWVLESNARATGISYRWLRDAFPTDRKGPDNGPGGDEFMRLNAAAAAVPPGANGVMAFAGPLISNVSRDYSLQNGFIGIRPRRPDISGRKEFARAILENMAYAIRGNIEQITAVTGSDPERICVGGGSAASSVWLEILAAITNRTLVIPRCREVSSIGCAVCAGVGAGVYPDFTTGAAALVTIAENVIPNIRLATEYGALYEKWRFFYDQFEAMSALASAKGLI